MRRRRADVHVAKMRRVGVHGLHDAVHGRRERMHETEEDFTSEVASLGGKEVTVRKYDKRKEVANANAKLGSSSNTKETSKRHGRTTATTISSKRETCCGSKRLPRRERFHRSALGKAYPTRVIVNMAQCTKEKSFGKGRNERRRVLPENERWIQRR